MAIDGSVWIATSRGEIIRFVQGRQETFMPQGVDPAFAGEIKIFTTDTSKNLYVLETQGRRVVVLDKEGIYLGQYVWEEDIAPSDLVVSETNKKLLLLAQGRLYSLDLQ